MKINAARGTIDITPEIIETWHWLENEIRSIMDIFQYKEIRTPIFERTELFNRGVGQETDIVTKEMYTFEDKGGRSLTLRPEGTASVVRSYIERKLYGAGQITKLYYIAPMFRYERPQAGRYRQHHQFGVEAMGADSPDIDIEVIALVMQLYQRLGLSQLQLRLNSVGCPECRPEYLNILKEYLVGQKQALCDDCATRMEKNTLRVLDCKNKDCKKVLEGAPHITDFLCDSCETHFAHVKNGLDLLKIEYFHDSRLVRGLDYYTKTTFEVVATGIGAQDSIAGGGRYDGLVEMLGGPPTPAVGFGAGMERLLATLEKYGVDVPGEKYFKVFFAMLDDGSREIGMPILFECRQKNMHCEMDFLNRSLKAQLKAANRMDARCAVIIGENEVAAGEAVVRDFNTKEQKQVAFSEICNYIMKEFIERGSDKND